MRIKNFLAAVAASSLVAAPVMAAPVASNPAKSLSVANARAGTVTKGEKLGGGAGFLGLAILAGVVAIVVIAATDNGGNNNSDSN